MLNEPFEDRSNLSASVVLMTDDYVAYRRIGSMLQTCRFYVAHIKKA